MKTAEEWVKEFDKTPQYYADYMGELVTAIQSDAIENTVRKCAEVIDQFTLVYAAGDSNIVMEKGLPTVKREILSLIPQKEKKA